ncbi:hypothetical protein JOC93_000207 [Priestia taiwanensis]|uniref:DUF3952 domain-containing protein n=2 Tax=Priestia taiwanensis TaxID=1347902 RepID=A0A917EKK5_9BACI|nr:hypothetical protein [Priestia taiwanensis]GGE55310.1 hypothetical protein GCM10007140_02070 [Priestia taiwanensis]
MVTVRSASDDGYAEVKEHVTLRKSEEQEERGNDKTILQVTSGIYNVNERNLYDHSIKKVGY